ncbi:hypothetical protein D6D01_06534 [Aureobasidium pullulans]|uniref:Uncharacterized protein n=1 Tax=Aureobasidium pullulans TaxID=5580 RepID=A0A4V4JUH4_AURPU|nr:hypothetical protein D6D01_06534 [Aureobasidium pullulans]
MARAAIPFAVTNVTTWTYEALKVYVGQNKSGKPKCYFLSFFDWSYEEYIQAREYAITELETQPFDDTAGFPTAGPKARLRHVIQKKLVREHPDLFVERHGSDPPTWFVPEFISAEPISDQPYNSKNVTQHFIAAMNLHRKAQKRNNFQYNLENNEDEDEDRNDQPQTKRQRTAMTERATPFPVISSMSMPPSPSATATGSQASEIGQLLERSKVLNRDGRGVGQAITSLSQSNPSCLILYITRVMIVDQQLLVNRQRFGIVENLFDQNRLDEARLDELLFGYPLDDSPLFLWFFHGSTNDKPRAIRNRPNAEAAIVLLKARAVRAGAEAIQLFDALDSDTAGLLPAHEVNRTTDFAEHDSFELEIDDGDENKDEGSEKVSRVDSAYGSRDGGSFEGEESRLDDEAIAQKIDLNPVIKRERVGQEQEPEPEPEPDQKQKPKQKVDSDSDSESESDEDEDISRFYR